MIGGNISNYNQEHYFAQVWSDQPGLELYTGNFLPDQVVDLLIPHKIIMILIHDCKGKDKDKDSDIKK